eukprot:CAMPEP_0181191638 /NCGR_PEP_ID=MMETSP1096-20121128/12843_1 /TAXON_ID=156174 ORGANISM="Chrysochromulina ericina, Strain CCMP281" /NCGR_SAMPLE_ID=MMETSP1096 /ASSEMBLY_ACC=CAM_ASM_000453 /LENGTH=38 /DNA_ID= /DNA_START= /DNA_END= /DNA_ORIENTATION=
MVEVGGATAPGGQRSAAAAHTPAGLNAGMEAGTAGVRG